MKKLKIAFLVLMLAVNGTAIAFDTETHALITAQAYSESVLASGMTVANLGLRRLDQDTIFNLYWYSVTGDAIPYYYTDGGGASDSTAKWPESFERCQMQEFLLPEADPYFQQLFASTVAGPLGGLAPEFTAYDEILPISNWLVRGAIREDDTGFFPLHLAYRHCGLEYEESQTGVNPRSLNHFYDPYLDWGLLAVNTKAVDWALGYVNSFDPSPRIRPLRGNYYSYADARNLFWWALTRETHKTTNSPYGDAERQGDAEDRMHLWATAFRSVGNVAHLLEDMAQPQHTRNDSHSAMNSAERQEFEDYTNDRVLGVTDEANAAVHNFFSVIPPKFTLLPPINNYLPLPMFSTPLRFFTTRGDGGGQAARAGLADYTNRGFFTAGTMPPGTVEALPDLSTGFSLLSTPCEELLYGPPQVKTAMCGHYAAPVYDTVNSGYVDRLPVYPGQLSSAYTLPPLASRSVLAVPVAAFGGGTITVPTAVMGLAELDTTGNLTIPRAVGYAAGMINFFFRGQLSLSSPPDGLYAVADQGTPHAMVGGVPVLTSDGVTTFGFNTVRLRVKNSTSVLVDAGSKQAVPQAMTSGTGTDGNLNGYLVAIAHYHRNPCYQKDLSGEYVVMPDGNGQPGAPAVPHGCSIAGTRTTIPEISVSQKVWINSTGDLIPTVNNNPNFANPCANVGNINTGVASGNCVNASALLEFDFSQDAIPINATDLFLQVAYRGQLGDETDGIAVGMIDLLEPNFYTAWNNTDWFEYNDVWTRPDQVPDPPGPDYFPPAPLTSLSVCFNDQLVAKLNDQQQLQPREFARIAVITDTLTLNMGAVSTVNGVPNSFNGLDGSLPGAQRQADRENWQPGKPDGGTFNPDPMAYYGRGTTLGYDFSQTFSFWGDATQDQYIKLLNLEPALGDDGAPGIPAQVSPQFTSTNDGTCESLFGGASGQAAQAKGLRNNLGSRTRVGGALLRANVN